MARRTSVIVCAAAMAVGIASVAGARPSSGFSTLQPVAGPGSFTFVGRGTFGVVKGTVTTRVVPSSLTRAAPVRFSTEVSWTETGELPSCTPGTTPGQPGAAFRLALIRDANGKNVLVVNDAQGMEYTEDKGVIVTTCGSPDTVRQAHSYEALFPSTLTKGWMTGLPGCYAHYPNQSDAFLLGPGTTYVGTISTLSVGGVACGATAGSSLATTFTDTFTTDGQAKTHAVTVPAKRTRADLTLRWIKPGDRFTVTAVTLAKRTTSAVGKATKLKITFGVRTPTSLGVRIGNLTPGKLSFKVVSTKVSTRATVRTGVVLEP